MKRMIPIVLITLAVSTSAWAQADEATVLSAAPRISAKNAIVKFKPDFTYDTVKKGTNRIVCYDRSGFPQQQPFSIECTSIANLDRVAQNMKAEALGDKAKTQAMLDAAEKDGTRVKPEFGSVWFQLSGPDKEHARPHMTVALPGATAQSMGLPDKPGSGGAWILDERRHVDGASHGAGRVGPRNRTSQTRGPSGNAGGPPQGRAAKHEASHRDPSRR